MARTYRVREETSSAHDALDTSLSAQLLPFLTRKDVSVGDDRNSTFCARRGESDRIRVDGVTLGRLMARSAVN